MKLTGVPFSSERTLINNPFFINAKKFHIEGHGTTESSATIVWKVLDEIGIHPLMFPAIPFHPNKPGNLKSNRTPNSTELAIGVNYLKELISIFEINRFVAVGKSVEISLSGIGIEAHYVRHPANGGANKFKIEMHYNFTK